MKKTYVVELSNAQRVELERLVGSGRESARKLTRARILLKADANAQGWNDARIAAALGVARATVERIRKRFAQGGLEQAVERRPQPERPAQRVLDGQAEARLTALACSTPPDGRESWSLELLADRMVRLKFVDSVSADTVGRVLKKTRSSRG
jgi:transposase